MAASIKSVASTWGAFPTYSAGDLLIAFQWGAGTPDSSLNGWTRVSGASTIWNTEAYDCAYKIATGTDYWPFSTQFGNYRTYSIAKANTASPIAASTNGTITTSPITIPTPATNSTLTSGSVVFNGSNAYLTVPANTTHRPGTGDFTTEAWVKLGTTSQTGGVLSTYTGSSGWWWGYRSSYAGFSIGNGDTWPILTIPYSTTGQWAHVAFCRSGTTLKGFLNGVEAVSTTSSHNFNSSSSVVYVGSVAPSISQYHNGSVSNARFTKSALYTGTFTPPTTPLSATPETGLLTCTSSTAYTDLSSNNATVTAYNTSLSDNNPIDRSARVRLTLFAGTGGGGNPWNTGAQVNWGGVASTVASGGYYQFIEGGPAAITLTTSVWNIRYVSLTVNSAPESGFFAMF